MADKESDTPIEAPAAPLTLEDLQHWTFVVGRAQQMMLEYVAKQMTGAEPVATPLPAFTWPGMDMFGDPAKLAKAQSDLWTEGLSIWQRALGSYTERTELEEKADKDKRFAAPQWQDNPLFDMIRQSYLLISDRLLGGVEALEGIDDKTRQGLRFMTRAFVEAMSPSNFAITNPQVIEKTLETRGENLLKGLDNMLRDISEGQMRQSDPTAFEIGRNIAMSPGKVVKQTPLYQLIQYAPTTDEVYEIPLIIFPPWINRFYILDLNPKKSFIRWAVEQGLTVFVVSWKSADESLADVDMGDYVLAEAEAIDAVRDLLGVESAHAIGYCVAGTMLAAMLAMQEARGESGKVATATFFTAQVDFSEAGDLGLFVGDEQLEMIRQVSADKGYLDGRYMAATFNMLRGRDLIWSYVVNNYLLGQDYTPFDLLYWNSDTTNLPAKWHQAYLTQLYRGNRLIEPGGLVIDSTPIDISKVRTPSYIQPAARTISRPRRACGRSPIISKDRCDSCSPDRAISPASSTRPRRTNINIGSTTGRPTRWTRSSPARARSRVAGGPTGKTGFL